LAPEIRIDSQLIVFFHFQNSSLADNSQKISEALDESYAAIDFGPESEDSGPEAALGHPEPHLQLPETSPQPPEQTEEKLQQKTVKEEPTEDDFPPPPPPPEEQTLPADSSDSDSESDGDVSDSDVKENSADAPAAGEDLEPEVQPEPEAPKTLSLNLDSVAPPSGFKDPLSPSSSDEDRNSESDDDMIAQRGPAVPVLAGPMKFSIGSYKDRFSREHPEPLKILDAVAESPMRVPQSPPPLPPPPSEDAPSEAKPVPKIETASVKPPSPVKYEAILLPEKPVHVIPRCRFYCLPIENYPANTPTNNSHMYMGNSIFFTLYLHNMFQPCTGSSLGAFVLFSF
jgi:hypothetical protein